MIKRILWVVLFTVLLLGGLFGLKFRQINQAIEHMQPPPPAVVALAEVRREQWPAKIASVGSLRAVAGINLSNEVAGQIKAIHFQSGQSVKQGQLLLELDSATDQAELKGLEASCVWPNCTTNVARRCWKKKIRLPGRLRSKPGVVG